MIASDTSPDGEANGVILITWVGYDSRDATVRELLEQVDLAPRFRPKVEARTPADVAPMLADCVAAIVSTDPIDRSVFERAPKLRVVARSGVGTDNIDLDAASDAGVIVTTIPEVASDVVADHTVALILAAVRRITENDSAMRNGDWLRGGALTPWDLTGKTVGIVGMGRVGRGVAARLAGFEVKLLVTDLDPRAVAGFDAVDFETLVGESDIVTLHLPLTGDTHRLVGQRELALMGPDSILVNTSRGSLIDEAALLKALRTGRLRAAALDVFDDEPPTMSRFEGLANVVLSPHIAAFSHESVRLMTVAAVRSVVDVLSGRLPSSVANPAVLKQLKSASALAGRGPARASVRDRP